MSICPRRDLILGVTRQQDQQCNPTEDAGVQERSAQAYKGLGPEQRVISAILYKTGKRDTKS